MADLRASGLGGVPKGTTADRPSSPSIGDVFYNGTLGYLEIYTSFGWLAATPTAAAIPAAPVGTNVGTSRAYNNGAVSVAFAPNQGGGLPSSFTITASTGQSASGATSPIIVTGIASAATPTFTVSASNAMGVSSASSASSAVTVTTVPQAPSISAVGGDSQAVLTLTGATGGSNISSWSITSNPATTTQTASSSPYTFTGLTNGTSYTFTATATNANGTSAESSASSSVTPLEILISDILVIAGGGAGNSNYYSGGGGAGGLRGITGRELLRSVTYTCTVGAGGANSVGTNGAKANSGINSSVTGSGFTTITASGGGGAGGTSGGAGFQGVNGGSGGGAGGDGNDLNYSGGAGNAGSYSPVEGYAGGGSDGRNGGFAGAGGGGGAGGVGQDGKDINNGGYAGDGGVGSSAFSSWGSATSSGQNVSSTYYYAGGGGGGYLNSDAASGDGGLGGGGAGKSSNAIAGTTNTGGGGGGCGSNASSFTSGAGGSGIIIMKLTGSITAESTTGSPTRYETGGFTYYKFNNTGSITF
jgi:hypothetical protein